MFSLIITIVSIALVVALVGATMYFGGDTLTQGRDKAEAAAVVAGAQQIAGAIQMYNAMEGEIPADIEALTSKSYLKSIPSIKGASGNWTIATDGGNRTLELAGLGDPLCDAVNAKDSDGDPVQTSDHQYYCDADKKFIMKI